MKVLAYTSPARGHLFPAVAILLELAARGHDVALRTLAADVPLTAGLGFDAAAIDPRVEALVNDDHRARTMKGGLDRVLKTFAARAAVDAPDLAAAIEATDPDLLLVDVNAWGATAAAERSGRPYAVFCPYPLPLPAPGVPPFGPGLAPATGRAGRLRDGLLTPVIVGGYQRALLPRLNAVRDGLGLPPLADVRDVFTRPPLLLALTAEPFEYPRPWPANVALVGPCEWEPPGPVPDLPDLPDRPIALVTTSSEFQDDGRLVEAALEGLSADFAVIATAPGAQPFVPHGPVLDHAVVAVTHGGMGATQKALGRGVPVCAVPFGRDQAEVARRVEVSGAGSRLPARRLTPGRLLDAVQAARARTTGAQRVAEAFAAAGGPRAAADALERLGGVR